MEVKNVESSQSRLVSIRIDPGLYRKVKMIAAAREETIKSIVERAFEAYIKGS